MSRPILFTITIIFTQILTKRGMNLNVEITVININFRENKTMKSKTHLNISIVHTINIMVIIIKLQITTILSKMDNPIQMLKMIRKTHKQHKINGGTLNLKIHVNLTTMHLVFHHKITITKILKTTKHNQNPTGWGVGPSLMNIAISILKESNIKTLSQNNPTKKMENTMIGKMKIYGQNLNLPKGTPREISITNISLSFGVFFVSQKKQFVKLRVTHA